MIITDFQFLKSVLIALESRPTTYQVGVTSQVMTLQYLSVLVTEAMSVKGCASANH